jgi:hypothetical protein
MARKIDASVARGQMRALVNPQVRFRAKISAAPTVFMNQNVAS